MSLCLNQKRSPWWRIQPLPSRERGLPERSELPVGAASGTDHKSSWDRWSRVINVINGSPDCSLDE